VVHLFAVRERDDRPDLDSITHDLNNLLTAISGYASLLVTNGDASPEVQRDAREIAEAAKRAAELVRKLNHR
jgi:signal transduction histidine kinase